MFTFHAYELLFMLRGAVIVGGVTAGLDVCQAGDLFLNQIKIMPRSNQTINVVSVKAGIYPPVTSRCDILHFT